MKAFIRFLLILLVTFSFSCSNSREYEEKAVGKQEIVKDTIEEKVELKLKNEPKLDLQEDTIVNVPKVINDTMPVVGLLLSVEESDFWGRVWLHTKIDGEYKNYAYWGEPNTEYIGSGSFEHVRKLVGKKIAVKFKIEERLEEFDLHYKGVSINGEYSSEKADKNSKGGLEGIMVVSEDDKAGDLPSDFRIVDNNGDTITISSFVNDKHIALNGKKVRVYCFKETIYTAESVVAIEKDDLNASTIFIGKWKKEDANNPISPTEFIIEERNDKSKYTVVLMNNIVRVFGGKINSTIITGESMFGNTELKIISENPPIISYSDKGYAERMEPMEGKKNVRFVKVKSYKKLLMGKWQSTDDKNSFVEFTEDLRIETNGDYEDTEGYSLSNVCKNGDGIASKENNYISGMKSGLCWYIISINEINLSLSFLGRGNTLNYTRVK